MKVLFWNTGKQKVDTLLSHIASEDLVDLIILAEYDGSTNHFIDKINHNTEVFSEVPQIGCKRITAFIRAGFADVEPGPESNYYTAKKLIFSDQFSMLMVAVHLPSKLNQSEKTQALEAVEFKREIEMAEAKLKTNNTFIVGDFNMNPFENGMIAASAFHSIPCQKIASSEQRIIKKRSHKYFYNPMWNLFGDFDENPGTYFHASSEQSVYFWNILDQVILRPSITNYFVKDSLNIIQKIDGTSLISDSGRPNYSDHLPITFEFNIPGEIKDEEFMARRI
ncbi:MAG: hypothetical protein KKD92_00750 [Proteobacteria bacterium]|nr:hypothetical protein [Pseudomonadota bacterium]